MNDFSTLAPQYFEGQISGKTLATETAKGPLNKIVGGLGPHIKTPFEVATGQSLFPDALNPRTIERGEALANVFGLVDEYRAAKGVVLGKGDRARPNYMDRLLFGVSDPRRNALHTIYDLRENFLKKQGKKVPQFRGISTFSNMRKAAESNDYEAFIEARDAYIEDGDGVKNFESSLRYLDPIANKLNPDDEAEFANNFLNDLQKKKLRVARDYAQELRVVLWQWWRKANREDK